MKRSEETRRLCERRGTHERGGGRDCKKSEGFSKKVLTPELVVVAAALRLPAAVSGLAHVALVVDALTAQETLQDTSTVAV